MPRDLWPWLIAVAVLAAIIGIAYRNSRKQIARTQARRPNPTREEFIALMQPDVSRSTSEFLWETMAVYLKPRLTPHPDDVLLRDLPIDDGDWSMDWPREFAAANGFHESNLHDWPSDWPVTVRNYGRWLDLGPML